MPKSKKLDFVLDISLIDCIENDRFVRLDSSEYLYAAAIKIPGIDIFHFKELDQDISMGAWGQGIIKTETPTKYVFIGCKPDFRNQVAYLAKKELKQENAFRRHVLERQRSWLEYYQQNEEERLAFVMFFGMEKNKIDDAMEKFINSLYIAKMNPTICRTAELVQLYKILLQGGNAE